MYEKLRKCIYKPALDSFSIFMKCSVFLVRACRAQEHEKEKAVES